MNLNDTVWRRLFAWTIFPFTFVGLMFVAAVLMNRGVHPAVAAGALSLCAAVVVVLAERIQPHHIEWSNSQDDELTDVAHMLFSEIGPTKLFDLLFYSVLLALSVYLTGLMDVDSLWPSHWNLALQIAFAMVISEFGQYWWHRLCHEHSWFWRFHVVHHSPGRLYWLNAGRFHPIDSLVSYALHVTPLIMLGASGQILAFFSLFTAIHGLFQHANIELRLGPLNWIFSMAELHRWHHSQDLRDANQNYGANVIFWDIIFGTRHWPRNRIQEANDIGFLGMEQFPKRYFEQLKVPFVW